MLIKEERNKHHQMMCIGDFYGPSLRGTHPTPTYISFSVSGDHIGSESFGKCILVDLSRKTKKWPGSQLLVSAADKDKVLSTS